MANTAGHETCRNPGMRSRVTRRSAALTQGAFFVATGVWPIVHMPSFERVTGPKTDRWLVRTLAGLIAVVGGTLIADALGRRADDAQLSPVLGIASASALGLSDVVYAGRGIISKVYLADAVVELGLVGLWLAALKGARSPAHG